MSGLNLVGKVKINGQEVDITKIVIYEQKAAKNQKIVKVLEEHKTLEESRVLDKQTLVATEVLTDVAK